MYIGYFILRSHDEGGVSGSDLNGRAYVKVRLCR
jgi:hypothetical protein